MNDFNDSQQVMVDSKHNLLYKVLVAGLAAVGSAAVYALMPIHSEESSR